jgi:hypothetical protein
MEPRPSWETNSRSATQEFASILWNPKVRYHVHNSPPLVSIKSQMNPVHTTPSCFSKLLLILSFHLRLSLPGCLFLLHDSSPDVCYIPCPSHPPGLNNCNYIRRRLQLMKFLILEFSPTSSHLGRNVLLSTLSSYTFSSSLSVRDQVSHTYRTTDKIIF